MREPGSSCSLMSLNSRSESPNPSMYSAGFASEFGKRILVGVCSMIVRAMGLASASLGLWVAGAQDAVQLAPDLEAILGELLEGRIGEQSRELIRPAHESPPIEERSDDVEEIQRDGCARDLVVQEFGDVGPEERRPRDAAPTRVSDGLSNAQA